MKSAALSISFALLLAVPGLMLSASAQAQFGRAPTVKVASAEMREMAPSMKIAGTVESRSNAVLAAEVEGRLAEVAEVGTRVEKGETVARIEDTALTLRVSELEAEIRRGESRVQYLDSELARVKRLAETRLVAANQIDEIRSDRDMAAADLDVTQSRLAQLRDQISRTGIEAPFSGVVVERLARAGERAGSGAQIVRMVDPDALEVVAHAPLRYYSFVDLGEAVEIDAGGQTFYAALRSKVSVGSENLHVFELRLDIQQSLLVGQSVRVTIPTASVGEVLAVPRDALVLRSTGAMVFVINEDDIARQVNVTTGHGQDDWIEIVGSVAPGERVVIRGNERLQAGQRVNVSET